MSKFQKFILESPDRVDGKIHHQNADAFPFGYFHGKFYFDKRMNGKTHYEMLEKFLMNGDKHIATQVTKKNNVLDSTDMKFHGRFWLTKKIISFWDYPDRANFDKVISELKKSGIGINSSWKVEVSDGKFVPIDEYKKEGTGHKINQIDHIMDPISKNVMKQAGKGVTTPTKISKIPSDMTFAQYRSLSMKSENMNESSEHYIVKCSNCDKVMENCRCSSLHKEVKYDLCDMCKSMKNEDASTVAPTSVANGQHQEKIGSIEKRKESEDDMKSKIKKKIKKKLNEISGSGHGPSSSSPSNSSDGHFVSNGVSSSAPVMKKRFF